MQETYLKQKLCSFDEGKYIGEITYDIDNFLFDHLKDFKSTSTYIMKFDKNTLIFRLPGATRGNIKIDNSNIIQSIEFYDDQCFGKIGCYKKEVVDYITSKYIGYKITFKN